MKTADFIQMPLPCLPGQRLFYTLPFKLPAHKPRLHQSGFRHAELLSDSFFSSVPFHKKTETFIKTDCPDVSFSLFSGMIYA
ncbi:MAG: hypothetical protein ACI4NN_01950 [Pyramidobacter sp.]|jgi:hypothetical protein